MEDIDKYTGSYQRVCHANDKIHTVIYVAKAPNLGCG